MYNSHYIFGLHMFVCVDAIMKTYLYLVNFLYIFFNILFLVARTISSTQLAMMNF